MMKLNIFLMLILFTSVLIAEDTIDSTKISKEADAVETTVVKEDSVISQKDTLQNKVAEKSVDLDSTILKDSVASLEEDTSVTNIEEAVMYGKLTVSSTPESASLFFDDEFRGVTPIIIDSINPGKHSLKLKKSGHYVKKASLNIKPSSSADIKFDLIKPATLTISSTPEKAVVSLNGKMVGQTPFKDSKLKPKKYEVSIQSPGFPAQDTIITLQSGAEDSLSFIFGKEKSVEEKTSNKIDDAGNETPNEETEEKTKIEKVLNKVAIGVFAAFTALILLIELKQNND